MEDAYAERKMKKFPFVMAVMSFVLSSVVAVAVAVGPVMVVLANITDLFAWIMSFFIVPTVLQWYLLALVVCGVMSTVAMLFAEKSEDPRAVAILCANFLGVFGSVLLLGVFGINLWVLLLVLVVAPIVALTARRRKERQGKSRPGSRELKAWMPIAYGMIVVVLLGVIDVVLFGVYLSIADGKLTLAELEKEIQESVGGAVGISEKMGEMAYTLCRGKFEVVYSSTEIVNEGIFECTEYDEYGQGLFWLKDLGKTRREELWDGEKYGFGQMKKEVEEVFPGGLYLYSWSGIGEVPDELKIALEASSEQEVIDKYGEKLYDVVKALNMDSQIDLQIIIYYNESFAEIKTSFDKLFLTAITGTNSGGAGSGFFCLLSGQDCFIGGGDPTELLNTIFGNPDNYPREARSAMKFNRHIEVLVEDGGTLLLEPFMDRLSESWEEGL